MKIDHRIAIGEGGGAQFAERPGFSQEEREARHAHIGCEDAWIVPKWIGELIAVSLDVVGVSGRSASCGVPEAAGSLSTLMCAT